MLRFYGAAFVAAVGRLEAARGAFVFSAGDREVNREARDTLKAELETFIEETQSLPLSQTFKRKTLRLRAQLDEPAHTMPVVNALIGELWQDFSSEMTDHVFLWVPSSRKWLYQEPEKWFGEASCGAFPEARTDMRDCARCLSLDQWTASVFHGMRILEHGLQTLASKLGVVFPTPLELENWKNIIDKIEKEIRTKEAKPKSAEKSMELQFYSEAAAQFWYLKEAWRNHVSHSRATYDEVRATEIANHVRLFMRQLSAPSIHGTGEGGDST
jgi:hypothetical protein